MKNKFLISCITLIVFFNFTIPSYALAASQKAFSRNVKAAPVVEQEAAEPVLIGSASAGELAEYVLPSSESLAEYAYPEKEVQNSEAAIPSAEKPSYDLSNVDLSKVDWSQYVAGQVYVQFKDNPAKGIVFDLIPDEEIFSVAPSLQKISQDCDMQQAKRMFKKLSMEYSSIHNIYKITFNGRYPISSLIESLQKDESVQYVEPVPVYTTLSVPNDPYYPSQQWGLADINPQPAWDVYEQNPGDPVIIAIVDDAVALNHQDLQANVWVNPGEIPGNGIDDDNNGWIDDVNGYDVADNNPDPNPPATATNTFFHHGTHVAGIAAGVTDNSIGVASISRNNVKIMAVKS
jgi:subtilisin family serine protease